MSKIDTREIYAECELPPGAPSPSRRAAVVGRSALPVYQFAERNRSAPWDRLIDFNKLVKVDVALAAVAEVRELRHILMHRRGELRTEKQRERFAGAQDSFMKSVAHLEAADVERRLEVLGGAVRSVDPEVYDHTSGGTRSKAVLALDDDPLLPRRRDRNRRGKLWPRTGRR